MTEMENPNEKQDHEELLQGVQALRETVKLLQLSGLSNVKLLSCLNACMHSLIEEFQHQDDKDYLRRLYCRLNAEQIKGGKQTPT